MGRTSIVFIDNLPKKKCGGIDLQHPAAIFKLRTGIAEQAGDLVAECRDDVGVEQGIQASQQQRADDYGDENLDAGIHIPLRLFAFDGGLNADGSGTNLVFHFVE